MLLCANYDWNRDKTANCQKNTNSNLHSITILLVLNAWVDRDIYINRLNYIKIICIEQVLEKDSCMCDRKRRRIASRNAGQGYYE